jgi:hypothetical protein
VRRPGDPRQEIARRREARARVNIVDKPVSESNRDGSVTTKQVAEVTLPREELDSIWSPEYLERLARTYWRFLTRVSLGLIRVLYTATSREIVLIRRPLKLLTFHAPEYDFGGNRASVTWRIRRGLLVAPQGRDHGYLRIEVERPPEPNGASDLVTVRVTSEVANFYPFLAGWGWFRAIGTVIYRLTQYAIHVVVTNAFFRSLARLDLAPSVVGALKPPAESEPAQERLTADG